MFYILSRILYNMCSKEKADVVYWDGENHYYIDGTVKISGNILLLIFDIDMGEYI